MQQPRRSFVKLTLATVPVVGLAGCMGEVESTNAVDIVEDGFDPENIRVSMPENPPASVTWTNLTDEDHQIASASRNWDYESQPVGPGQMVHAEFNSEGVYDAVCSIHGDPDDFENSPFRMRIAIGDETDIEDTI